MKPSQTKKYSMLLLKGAQERNIEESWPTILHDVYLLSKGIVTWFPLPRGLIESVDRIFDEILAYLGTEYLGIWYLQNSDETNISELMRGAKHFISDDARILRLAIGQKKPCFYFSRQMKRSVFMSKDNNSHEIWAEEFGVVPSEIIYYEDYKDISIEGTANRFEACILQE